MRNWKSIMRGEVAVQCNTLDGARKFLDKCVELGAVRNRVICKENTALVQAEFGAVTAYVLDKDTNSFTFCHADYFSDRGYKVLQCNDLDYTYDTNRKLKFEEVIANIKVGEEWCYGNTEVTKTNSGVMLSLKNIGTVIFADSMLFEKKKVGEDITFARAMELLSDGEEVMSCYSEYIYKIVDETIKFRERGCEDYIEEGLIPEEIMGVWQTVVN
ncbi:MAG: hypothetical protein ACRCZB_09195 [Bacteroidales bacterium]